MGYEFRPDSTPVLYYKPKNHVPFKQGCRRFLLWPAYGYRVLAPRATRKKTNLFQKAVLGFCRSGQTDAAVIANFLHLDTDLVTYILVELRRAGLLNVDYLPTIEGNKLLQEELDEAPAEIVTGIVFQEPWQNKLWPRVMEKVEFAPAEIRGEEKFPVLVLGTKGNPREYWPFVKRVGLDATPFTPTSIDILNALRRHKRDLARGGSPSSFAEIEDEEILIMDVDVPDLEKIELISEEPEPFYLTTYIYIPEVDARPGEWYVCDPFGIGASSLLYKYIEQQLSNDLVLKEFIDRFLIEVFGEKDSSGTDSLTLEELAKEEVKSKLSVFIETYPFFDQLVAMERSFQEVGLYPSEPPKDKLGDVLIKAGKALEAVFAYLRSRFPIDSVTEIYATPDWQYRYSLLNDISENLGFRTPIPRNLANYPPKNIHRAAKNGSGTLGERLVIALLTARKEPEHPLRKVANHMPDLLERISMIIKIRGFSAHDTRYEISMAEVEKQLDISYQIVRELSQVERYLVGEENG